ncbi:MAG: Hsp20/alpha crystallin family protein [Patescibacteria group bacterium]
MSTSLIDRMLEKNASVDDPPQGSILATPSQSTSASAENIWTRPAEEGELAVDVYQTASSIIIISVIAGVNPKDISVEIQNDIVTIRGRRQKEEQVADDQYLYQECYWGPFSRSIVLPVEVNTEEARATFRNGTLKLEIPKSPRSRSTVVEVIDEGEDI